VYLKHGDTRGVRNARIVRRVRLAGVLTQVLLGGGGVGGQATHGLEVPRDLGGRHGLAPEFTGVDILQVGVHGLPVHGGDPGGVGFAGGFLCNGVPIQRQVGRSQVAIGRVVGGVVG